MLIVKTNVGKLFFSNEYIDQIPEDSINISYEFKDGFLKNSPQQATEEIMKSLRRYEQDRISI